jgi:hypothetical protein
MIEEICSVFRIKIWELFFITENLDNPNTIKKESKVKDMIHPKVLAILLERREFNDERNS